ncbi:MAG: hypothetical protein JWM85_659 [Acidimicrobiaceae bacterium]|nr:hypothetical protein [Acidimicrobiaceae bacterium]
MSDQQERLRGNSVLACCNGPLLEGESVVTMRRALPDQQLDAAPAEPSSPPARDPVIREPDRDLRVRRPADLLLAIVAVLAVGALFGIAHTLPIGTAELNHNVSSWISNYIPRGLTIAFAAAADVGSMVLLLTATVTLVRTARRDGLNALIASVLGLGIALGCVLIWRSGGGGVAVAMLHGSLSPAFVFVVGFIAFLVATDLGRRPRWTRWYALSVVAVSVGELVVHDLNFMASLLGPLIGLGVGAIIRWSLTTSSVRPSTAVLSDWLSRSGVPVASLAGPGPDGGQAGALEDGTPIVVLLANRDTRGSGLARRLWRTVRLRGAATGVEVLSSRNQLEHHALAGYSATAAGVIAPRVLLLAEAPPETLVLALAPPLGRPVDASTTSSELEALFAALRTLHRAGVAHRDLRPPNYFAGPDGAGFTSLARAQTGSGELLRRLDVAQLLTSLARVVGAAEAVKAFRAGYSPDDETAIAEILQPVALAPWGWAEMRAARGCLAAVRVEIVGPDAKPPELRLERFRWRTVVSAVAVTLAAFILVGELSKVDLLGALRETNPGWFLLAVLASALGYLGAAINLAAFVPKHLSMVRGFWVQLSSAFVGLAMPPTVGHVAVNGRYLHRQGVDEGTIAAAVAVSQIVNVVSTVPLLVVIGLITGTKSEHFKIVPGTDILVGLAAIVVIIGALVAIPRTRALVAVHVWPHIRVVIPRLLEAISQPVRLAVGVAGNLLLTASRVVALIACLLAIGVHPPILATAAVYLAGNTVGSIAPTPGGLGAVEAVLSAGLTALGIPAHQAVPAVLLFRTATFWLPIPAGWISYLMLQRSGTL